MGGDGQVIDLSGRGISMLSRTRWLRNRKLVEIDRQLTKLIKSVLDEDHFKASQDIQKKVAAREKRQEKVEQIKEPRQLRKERYAIVRWPSPLEFFVKQEEPCAKPASVGQRPSDESEESKE